MKNIYLFGIFLLVFSNAVGADLKESASKKVHAVKCVKPGAPVQIRYKSEQLALDTVGKIDIVLTTQVAKGKMKVLIKTDKGLDLVLPQEHTVSFDLDKTSTREYPLNAEVSASEDGLYSLKLLVFVENQGRAFVVPVKVGTGVSKAEKKPLKKTSDGKAISVSPAQEGIIK